MAGLQQWHAEWHAARKLSPEQSLHAYMACPHSSKPFQGSSAVLLLLRQSYVAQVVFKLNAAKTVLEL